MMKKIALLSALSLAALSNVYAADGTITITGNISDSSCIVSSNTGNADFAVALPTVSASALSAAGATAGRTPFTITVSECDGTQVATYFEAGSNLVATTGNLQNNGTAENVQVQLLGSNAQAINLASADSVAGQENSQWVAISGNSATLNYAAQYYAADTATVGDISTEVQYTMIYQ